MAKGAVYLLGGCVEAFESMADGFVADAGGQAARIAILLMGSEGWERHAPSYTAPWVRRGVSDVRIIVPDAKGRLPATACSEIAAATGIVMGGGHTPTYRRLYVVEPLRAAISQRVQAGAPYAGLSAGALLAPETCALRGYEPGDPALRLRRGLGLMRGLSVAVHFDARPQMSELLDVMSAAGTHAGLGIGERACVVIDDGEVARVVVGPVYRVTMSTVADRTHSASRLA